MPIKNLTIIGSLPLKSGFLRPLTSSTNARRICFHAPSPSGQRPHWQRLWDLRAPCSDREVVSSAAKLIVSFIGNSGSTHSLDSTQRRIDFLMEFLAVSLSLPIESYELMEIARQKYRSWFQDSSIFGDKAAQNHHFRLMIKQLSLPFDLRPSFENDLLRTKVRSFLLSIIQDSK
jgi:hypothetical protein